MGIFEDYLTGKDLLYSKDFWFDSCKPPKETKNPYFPIGEYGAVCHLPKFAHYYTGLQAITDEEKYDSTLEVVSILLESIFIVMMIEFVCWSVIK